MENMSLKNYAYIGDAVWELFIRERTIKLTDNAKRLHKLTTDKVKASYQAELLHFLEPELTEEEQEIARRGRNLSIPVARRQNQGEYRQATAFETLIGWWHIHNSVRLSAVLELIGKQLVF